jgi:hypothetical protein
VVFLDPHDYLVGLLGVRSDHVVQLPDTGQPFG